MSLQVWLPLNGDLYNQGLCNTTITNNGVTIDNNGKIGKCYSFNKSIPSYLKIDNPITSAEHGITFTFWIKIAANASGNNQIIHIGNGAGWNNNRCTCFIRSGTSQIVFCCGDGTDTSASHSTQYNCISSAIDLNTWVHITCIYFNKNLKIYINGIQNKSYNTTIIPSFANVNYIGIGAAPNAGEPCSCMLNDVRIYNHCLSQKEVEEISKGLVLHYKLDGNGDIIIPSEYQQLEYIESTGASWLNTGYIFNPETDSFKVVFKGNDTSNNGMIFASNGTKYSWLYYYSAGMRIYITNSSGSQQTVAGPARDTNQHIAIYNNKHYYLDGVDKGSLTGSYVSDTNPIYLFAYAGSGTNYAFKGRIYSVEISRNNNIQKIFIPSKRLSDNAIGMYEIYSKTFIPSMTSTAFTAGPAQSITSIIYDSSGYQNNGILNTSITVNSNTARYDRSSYFGNYNEPNIILQNTNILPALNNCTVCWWGKYDTTKTLLLTGQNTSTYLAASNANTFYHAAAGSPVMYKNGVQGTYSCTAGTWDFYVLKNVNFSSWTAMKINSYGSGWPLKGYISDFRIYAAVLTDDQIKELYNTSATIDNLGNVYAREMIE